VKPDTIVLSLAIGNPASGTYSLETLEECNGQAIAAPENEVAECIKLLAETEGIFTETAGGVVISSLRKLAKSGVIKSDETTVAYITGNGLKTQEVVENMSNPVLIEPTYESFQTITGV
jgi:threonine synthase